MEYITNAPLGAALLDKKLPGWAARVNRDELSIASIYRCPLGQLYGQYGEGLRALFGARDYLAARDYGFDLPRSAQYDSGLLTREWLALIAERTAGKEAG